MSLDVLEVGDGALELPAVDGLGGLAGVLEGDTEVGAASAGALSGLDLGSGVADLVEKTLSVWSFSGRGARCGGYDGGAVFR